MNQNMLLTLFVGFGFLIRVWNLPNNPPGFFADEASIGYNAYSLLTTGKDEHGQPWPLFFQAFGEYKSPVEIYSTIPFIALFGLNEFAVRLPSAIYGSLTIIAIYFLTKIVVEPFMAHKINKSVMNHTTTLKVQQAGPLQALPFLAAFFLAISPWHIHFSRTSFEQTAFVFFTTTAVYLFLKSLRLKSVIIFNFSLLTFNLALYSYFPARIFIPLFVSALLFIFRKKFSLRTILTGVGLFFLLTLPMGFHILSGQGLARFQQVSIFAKTHLTPRQKLVHITTNYLNHFSPTFLFTKGDIDFLGQFITRHSVRGMGQLYLWQAPLLLLAIFALIKTGEIFRRSSENLITLKILGLWFVLYPLGSVVTSASGPQATRSIIGVVPFQILTALGIVYLYSLISLALTKLRLSGFLSMIVKPGFYFLISIFVLVVAASFTYYLRLYFIQYPRYAADFWGWQYGPREIVGYFKKHHQEYDEFYLSPEFNAPEIFLKFYDPDRECNKCSVGIPQDRYNPTKKQLFAVSPQLFQQSAVPFTIIHQIYYPNGEVAFFLITNR